MEEFKPLSPEETCELVAKAKSGDEQAKERLIEGNFPLIKSIVRGYQNKGVDYDDLYQIGCVGFLKAINNFDPSFAVKFSTYAVPMVAGEIKRFLRDDGNIKVSRAIKSLWIKIKAYLDEFKKQNKELPTVEELAKKFEVDPADVIYAMDSSQQLISLNAQLDESSQSSQSVLDRVAADDKSEQLIDKILLKDAINKLPSREKQILILRYFRGKTQSEVAEMCGVSQVQISRIESRIIEKLKKKIL